MDAFAMLQQALPKHALSRALGALAASERPAVAQPFIRAFAAAYRIDLGEAERTSFKDYRSFNDFFTRALRANARPLPSDPDAIVCPADGTVSQAGTLVDGQLLQAKGQRYPLDRLLGRAAPRYAGGDFATIYLAPSNYHRVHLPIAGELQRTTALPGALFSVNARTEAHVRELFCRNERLVCEFETALGGLVVVLVGALIVASIETVWGGTRSPYRQRVDQSWSLTLPRGAEIGRFLLGSTVIVCTEPGRMRLDPALTAGRVVRMGEAIGRMQP